VASVQQMWRILDMGSESGTAKNSCGKLRLTRFWWVRRLPAEKVQRD
jgi:hypothetical protein